MSEEIFLGEKIELEEGTRRVLNRHPFTIPRRLFGHAHIRGRTRQGKTSFTLIELIWQLLQPYFLYGVIQRCMFAIFDLKGDPNLFHNAKAAAAATGRVFKYLIIDAVSCLDSFHFPCFQYWSGSHEDELAATETITQGLGLDFGNVYGAMYYMQQNVSAMLRMFEHCAAEGREPSFREIAALLDNPKIRREFKDADQMRLIFSLLAKFRQLTPHPDPARNIDVRAAIEEGHVLYFWCRTLRQAMTARFIAGIALYTIIALTMERNTRGGAPRHSYVAIDEFQELVSRSIGSLMAQSGAWLSLILLNQSTSQLQNRDLSMADFIFENTTIKQYFTCVGDEDIRSLQALSSDKRIILGGATSRGLASTSSYREMIVPSLDADVIRDVSATFGRSFFIVDDGRGHANPTIVEQVHRYPDHSHTPMPLRASDDVPHSAPTTAPPSRRSPANDRWQAMLGALWSDKTAEEQWP